MNLFLDCGSNLGQGFKQFSKKYGTKDFIYFLFEPNPYCFEELENKFKNIPYITLHNVAVGTADTELEFFYKKNFDQGGTLIFEHGNSLFSNSDSKLIKVKCINLSEYIKAIENNFDKIIMKLDIESAEYDVLENLIESNLLTRFEKLYIEFHAHYMEGLTQEKYVKREKKIIEYMSQNNIKFELWK